MVSNGTPCPHCTTSPLLLDTPETPHEPLRGAKSPGDAGQPSQHWSQNLQNRTWPDAPSTTDSAGLCPLSIIATYKNSNLCYWKRYTQERESEVVTQSVTPCWLNLAALACFCLKHPRVSWFSIMTFYMNKWITWEKKLSNAPPRPFDFQPAKRPTTEGQTCIFPLEVSLPTITSSLFFHSQSSHGFGSPLTHNEVLATLHLRICMDLWQIQHFPVLSLKNYQPCVVVQNANIPMTAFKKSQTIINPTNKKPKKVEKRNQTGA